MIYTSNYIDCIGKDNIVSISFDKGKSANFVGSFYGDLVPEIDLYDAWKDNVSDFSEIDNNRFFTRAYIKNVLLPLDPEKVYKDLDECTLVTMEKRLKFMPRVGLKLNTEMFTAETKKERRISSHCCGIRDYDKLTTRNETSTHSASTAFIGVDWTKI